MKRSLLIKLTCLLFAGHFFTNASAQKILLVSGTGQLYSLDVSSGTCVTQEVILPCSANPSAKMFSIALYKDTLYYIATNGGLYQNVLGNPSSCKQLSSTVFSNALTVDRNGMLYYIAGADLFKFDPHTSTGVLLGRVPFTSAGDLVFYKDKLLLASTMGVVEIDTTAHPMVSTLLMATPGHNFFGVFNIPFGCNANRVYGIESTAANSGTIVELDLDNKKILGNYCTLPVGVNDAASITESGITQGITVNNINIKPQCDIAERGSVFVNALSASANVSLQFTLNNSAANSDGKFTDLNAGRYAVHIKSSDGCSLDTTVAVQLVDKLTVLLAVTPDICGAKNGSVSVQKLSGTDPLSFSLNNSAPQSNPVFMNLSAGTYALKATDRNGCSSQISFPLLSISPPLPVSSVAITPASCKGGDGSIKLTFLPSANITGISLDGGNVVAGDNLINVSAGQHHVQIITSTCVFDTALTVPQQAALLPVISFTNKSPDCNGGNTGSSDVHVTNIAQPFTVSFNGGVYASVTNFTNLAAGIYPVKVKDSNGCEWTLADTVPVGTAAKPFIQTDITHAECWQSQPGKLRLTISGPGAPYQFELKGQRYVSGQEATKLPAGSYFIRIFTATGCLADSATLIIKNQNSLGANCDTVYVPSAFTPNGDGSNDVLRPIVSGSLQSFVFRIYNRWGQLIFETKTPGQGWDGKLKGIQQSSAVYVWMIECRDTTGGKKNYQGTFVLIR